MKSVWRFYLLSAIVLATAFAAEKDPAVEPFQGRWEVIELIENGHVIPHHSIREWLPSGGKIEIIDNAITYTSSHDGKKHARVFAVDGTQNPKGFDLVSRDRKEASGIVKFEDGNLVVCISDPEDGPRPSDFSAKIDSKRMLMTLRRIPDANSKEIHEESPTTPSATLKAGQVLTDAEVSKMLPGTWRFQDEAGVLVIKMTSDGKWSSTREVQQLRVFRRVFVETPISSGHWSVKNGTLNFHCTASIHLSRINKTLPFTIRSISEKDLIFVDYMGRVGKAVKAL
ncbi:MULTISPECIES: TIGR03067 domain-containing protein [unclassified Schlesneria]|uniref:TIGR03067 domain-containing protein n=1 Tax=Schlesneria TaxID=656899 RepID=UPI0035A1846F